VIQLPVGTKVWIAAGVTDLRRGFDGLSAQVQVPIALRLAPLPRGNQSKHSGPGVLRIKPLIPGYRRNAHSRSGGGQHGPSSAFCGVFLHRDCVALLRLEYLETRRRFGIIPSYAWVFDPQMNENRTRQLMFNQSLVALNDQSLFSIRINFSGKSLRFSTECGACGGLHCTKGTFGFTLSWRESKRTFPLASRSIMSPACWI